MGVLKEAIISCADESNLQVKTKQGSFDGTIGQTNTVNYFLTFLAVGTLFFPAQLAAALVDQYLVDKRLKFQTSLGYSEFFYIKLYVSKQLA